MKSVIRKLIALTVFASFGVAAHAISFVGSYNVTDGENWWDNPDVYSAIEAAELIFGPAVGGVYRISTIDANPLNINDLGWYSVIGIGFDTFDPNYKKDEGPTIGYNGGGWTSGDDISAYVNDPHSGWQSKNNYVFFERANVSDTGSTITLLGLGVLGLAGLRRRFVK